jgi:hypothetical protein
MPAFSRKYLPEYLPYPLSGLFQKVIEKIANVDILCNLYPAENRQIL